MVLNKFGEIVNEEWKETFRVRHELSIDAYVIIPNHLHAIIAIHDSYVWADGDSPHCDTPLRSKFHSPSQNIGSAIRGFKSSVTSRINALRKTPDSPIWQRNYYEKVVRDEKSSYFIREYIANNPKMWALKSEGHIHDDVNLIL